MQQNSLIFTDVNIDEISFESEGDDAVLRIANGDVITLKNVFDAHKYYNQMPPFQTSEEYWLDSIQTADGAVLTIDDLLNMRVILAQDTAFEIGGAEANDYFHAPGWPSYVIHELLPDSDYTYTSNNTLTFHQANPSDLTVIRQGFSAVLQLSTGEEITLDRIFQPTDKYWLRDGLWLDGIHFGDGTVWTIEDLAVAQAESAKSSGIVFGSGYSDAFTHSQGDGSYFIQELTSNNSNTITFDDVTSDDVTIYQSGDDAIIKLANGEEVQIADQFLKDTQHPIDSLKFSDGTVWSAEDIVARIDPSDLGRHFVGALGDDAYTYTRGDGSISISDSDSGNDTLVFTDTTPDQLIVRRMKDDAVFQLDTGETVVVNDYFVSNHENVVERIEFSDGTVWTQD
ncbi:MAG: calcium-binding protein, partial [Gammaproteobacteria bacterium]